MVMRARKAATVFAVLTAAGLFAGPAGAATVSCPNTTATSDREFTLVTSQAALVILCRDGNSLDGTSDPVNDLGYLTVDTSADLTTGLAPGSLTFTGAGTTSGSFSFIAPLGYYNFVIGFQANPVGNISPDQAAFLLPAGVTSGTWNITSTDNNLGSVQRAILYAQPVPLPAAAWLLLSGLLGVGVFARRRS